MKPFFKMPNPIPFTKAGYEKVKQDIEYYSTKRKKAVINLKTAREMGDLSENAAYKAARFELGNIDRQLRNLNYLLRFGVVTEEIRSDRDKTDKYYDRRHKQSVSIPDMRKFVRNNSFELIPL